MKRKEQIEAKRLHAGDKKPSMKRRDDHNDYHGRRMYMITLEVEGRRPLLGEVVGDPFSMAASPEAPHVELSPIGAMVQAEWQGIPRYYPQVEVLSLQMMPDHLHGILFVHESLPVHLGHVLGGFKKGCERKWSAMLGAAANGAANGAAAKPQPTPNAIMEQAVGVSSSAITSPSSPVPASPSSPLPASPSSSVPASPSSSVPASPSSPLPASPSSPLPASPSSPVPASPSSPVPASPSSSVPASPSCLLSVQGAALPQLLSASKPRLFALGYNDLLLKSYDELQRWKHYLADNPRRLLLKRARPEFLRPRFNMERGGYTFAALGNLELLDSPCRLQVRVSRRCTSAQVREEVARYLAAAREGAVLVSPSISPGEKAVMRAAFDARLPLIVLVENGFTPLTKPRGEQFDACAAGRLLLLAPWEHHNDRRAITVQQCQQLNLMATALCW